MIGKLLKARHLMMFQMTSSFQPVVSRRERSQPPRKSMSNNCERSFPLHLITLIHILTTRKVYACFARYFKKYCSQCHSIYPDNRITRVLCSQNLSSISWVISVGIAGRSSAQGGQTQLGPTMFNVYGTFLSDFQLNRSWLTQKPCQLDPIGKACVCTEEERVDWRRSKTNRLEKTRNYPCVDVLNMTDLNCRVLFTRRSGYCGK